MNQTQKKVINELHRMKTLDLEIMKYTYGRIYHGTAKIFEYEIHILKCIKCKNGWKSVSRDQRRWSYKQVCIILKLRKEFENEETSKSNRK